MDFRLVCLEFVNFSKTNLLPICISCGLRNIAEPKVISTSLSLPITRLRNGDQYLEKKIMRNEKIELCKYMLEIQNSIQISESALD